jgi:tripartite-type tricarboxylate transporter receptor subunit TctC
MPFTHDSIPPRQGLTRRRSLQLAGAALLAPRAVAAQNYPGAPIMLVIPLPPGGVLDILARGCSERFRKDLGHPLVVVNVPGATSMLGATRVAHARPDGYTALLTVSSPIVTGMFMFREMPFDPDKDLAPVLITSVSTLAIVVHQSVPVTTLQEFIAYARAHPGELTIGSSGIGSPHHIAGEYLAALTGISLTHIPYKGSTESTNDVLAGHVKSAVVAFGGVAEQARAGNVRVLAITDDQRSPLAPDIPTVGEIIPGYVHAPAAWNGMFVPAQTPKEIVAVLNRQMNAALHEPEFERKLKEIFLLPVGGPPEAVTEKIHHEREVTKSLIGRLGLVPQ